MQFAILGPMGEVVAASILKKRLVLPCSPLKMLEKVLAWAILGVVIKYGFVGMKGFTKALLEYRTASGVPMPLLPAWFSSGVGLAFATSVFTNLLFGKPLCLSFCEMPPEIF